MATSIVVSTILMGIFLLVIIAGIMRFRAWRSGPESGTAEDAASAGQILENPMVWTLVFVVLVALFGGGAVLFVSGPGLSEAATNAIGMGLAVAFALVLAAYLFWGTYVSAKNHGLASSLAAALGSWVLGLILVIVVTAKLLLG